MVVDDAGVIEKLLHEAFSDKRVRPNREFFNCTPEQAKSALRISEKMGGKNVTPTKMVFESESEIVMFIVINNSYNLLSCPSQLQQ